MKGRLIKNLFWVLILLLSNPGFAQVDVQKQKELFDFTTNGTLVNLTLKELLPGTVQIGSEGPFFITVGIQEISNSGNVMSRDLEFSLVQGNGKLVLLKDPEQKEQDRISVKPVMHDNVTVLFYPSSADPALVKVELTNDKGL